MEIDDKNEESVWGEENNPLHPFKTPPIGGDYVDDKIKKLDSELARYKEQIKKTRPGPAHEAVKARAMRVLKQKKMYEGQRDMSYNQTFNLDQVAFAAEGIKDAQQTMSALTSANNKLKGMMKNVKIQASIRAELDALETEGDGVPAHLQPDNDLEAELNLPSALSGHAPIHAGRANAQGEDELGLPAVPRTSF